MVFVKTHTDLVDEFNGLIRQVDKPEESHNTAANDLRIEYKELYDWWMKKSNFNSKRIYPTRKLELSMNQSPSRAREIRLLHGAVRKKYGLKNGVIYYADTRVIKASIRRMKLLLQDDGGD